MIRRSVTILGLVLLMLVFAAGAATAENFGPGGGSRVVVGEELIGPYKVLMITAPDPAQVGTVSFLLRLQYPGGTQAIRNADVNVRLVLASKNLVVEGAATHRDANSPDDYAAHLQVAEPGVYDGLVTIKSATGPAEIKFVQRVVAQRQSNTLFLLGIPFAVLGVIAWGWYVRSAKRT